MVEFATKLSAIPMILLMSCGLFAMESSSAAGKAWTILEEGLRDRKAGARVEAVSALGVMAGDRKAIQAAENALQDADSDVCRAAVTALAEMQAKSSVPRIKGLLTHADAKTVIVIAAALKTFKDPEAYEIYYEVLTGKRRGGGSILDGIKDKRAVEKMAVETAVGFAPFGGFATGAYNYLAKNGSAQASLDVTAVTALADDRNPVTEKALVQASFDHRELVQIAALHALAKRGSPSVIEDIRPAMYANQSLVRYTTAATILHLLDVRGRQGRLRGRVGR